MRLIPSDPDLQTIVKRILDGSLDLQPGFQRGEVWGEQKKRRLIDTILRNWYVPAIHVIENPKTAIDEVLDGQQRLVAIRDFVKGDITVDGYTPPLNHSVKALHKCTYENLPVEVKRRFNNFPIRLFRLIDFDPSEPAELFYRLNQPTHLTTAEQRNAFFGPARAQIKSLVKTIPTYGEEQQLFGFSNSRMALDDIFARVCYTLEAGTLCEKITPGSLAAKYRDDSGFSQLALDRTRQSVETLCNALVNSPYHVKFNKATLFSWLVFIAQKPALKEHRSALKEVLLAIDVNQRIFHFENEAEQYNFAGHLLPAPFISRLLFQYVDRSSARVSDISSVLTRDIVIWMFFCCLIPETFWKHDAQAQKLINCYHLLSQESSAPVNSFKYVNRLISDFGWGQQI